MKKVLAIDPSSSIAGFALFYDDVPQWCVSIKPKGATLVDRMSELLVYIGGLLEDHKPDYIAIETPYLGISKSTSMKMGQIFGMICAILVLNKFSSQNIIEIHPMTAKKAAGVLKFKNRAEGKATVLSAMHKSFPNLVIIDDNSSDALAIGLAGINTIKEHNERKSNKVS